MTVLHLVAPFAVVSSRKNEMSAAGQAAYDQDMIEYHSSLPGAHYLVFCNDATLAVAAQTLTQYIDGLYPAGVPSPSGEVSPTPARAGVVSDGLPASMTE